MRSNISFSHGSFIGQLKSLFSRNRRNQLCETAGVFSRTKLLIYMTSVKKNQFTYIFWESPKTCLLLKLRSANFGRSRTSAKHVRLVTSLKREGPRERERGEAKRRLEPFPLPFVLCALLSLQKKNRETSGNEAALKLRFRQHLGVSQ